MYNQFGRTYLFDLDFHYLKEGHDNWTTKYVVDAYHAGNVRCSLNLYNFPMNQSSLSVH